MKVEITGLYDAGDEWRKAHTHFSPDGKSALCDGWDGPNPVVYVEGEELIAAKRSRENFLKRAEEINQLKKAEDELLDKLALKIIDRINKLAKDAGIKVV